MIYFPEKVDINGIKIISGNFEELPDFIKNILLRNGPTLIVTLNIDFLRIAEKNQYFKEICQNASAVFPDGMPVTWLARLKSGKKMKRITGFDLFSSILDASEKEEIRIAVLGSEEDKLNKTEEFLKKTHPGIRIVRTISPPPGFENDTQLNEFVIKELRISSPDILLAALGCPRQEIWLRENMEKVGASINIGVGGIFDIISGEKKRAPRFLQRAGLEWLWRLSLEPGRLFSRYIIKDLPFFIWLMFKILFRRDKR